MDLVSGLIALFGVAGAMVFFVGSLILIKGVKERYLSKSAEDHWLEKRH